MGAIQSAINQALGTAAMASAIYQHSAAGKTAAIGRDIKSLDKQEAQVLRSQPDIPAEAEPDERAEMEQEYATSSLQKQVAMSEKRQALIKQQFELTGRGNYYDALQNEKTRYNSMQNDLATATGQKLTAQQAQQRAMEHMQNAQEERRTRERVSIYGSRGEVING